MIPYSRSTMCTLLFAAPLALGALTLSPRLLAQPAPSVSAAASVSSAAADQPTLTARARFLEAVPLMKQDRWQDAYPLLTEAWKNKHHWQIALNLGRTEVEIGKYRDAVEHLTFAEAAQDIPLDDSKEASNQKERAKAKIGHLHIDASPRGARVFVDGQIVDRAPVAAPVAVDPGPHDVELRLGERRKARHVTVKSGETAEVLLALRILDPDPAATGTPMAPSSPVLGTAPNEMPSVRTILLATGSVLTVAGLLAGASLGVLSLDLSAKRDASLNEATWNNLENQRAVLQNAAAWCFFAAGAGAIALGTAVLWRSKDDPKSMVRLHYTGSGGGVSWVW